MNGDQRFTVAPSADGHLAARYEELRSHALNGSGRGAGLMVFLRQGMRAWMEACPQSASVSLASMPATADALPLPARTDVVLVLAAMALGNRQVSQRRV